MIKIKLEHGRPFGSENSYMMKLTTYNSEDKHFCDVLFNTPYLSKISEDDLNNLVRNIEESFSLTLNGLLDRTPGVEYDPLLAELIKKELK